jgi:hypothetical protein
MILRYFFFILFAGYYGSITLFTHTHIHQGAVVVHSHPNLPFSGEQPSKHEHSDSGYLIIQLLSAFSVVFAALVLSLAMKRFVTEFFFSGRNMHIPAFRGFCTFLLRAPPVNIHK